MPVEIAAGTALARVLQSLAAYRRTVLNPCGSAFSLLKAVVHCAVVLQEPSMLLAATLKPLERAFVKGTDAATIVAIVVEKRMLVDVCKIVGVQNFMERTVSVRNMFKIYR